MRVYGLAADTKWRCNNPLTIRSQSRNTEGSKRKSLTGTARLPLHSFLSLSPLSHSLSLQKQSWPSSTQVIIYQTIKTDQDSTMENHSLQTPLTVSSLNIETIEIDTRTRLMGYLHCCLWQKVPPSWNRALIMAAYREKTVLQSQLSQLWSDFDAVCFARIVRHVAIL